MPLVSRPSDFSQITEHRSPGSPMQPLNLKLPTELIEQLREQASRLGCYPSALGRHLIAQGLQCLSSPED